jgi:putative hydrolases of HD superfamily
MSQLSTLDRDVELLFEIGCLRHIQRQWHQFLGIPFANLAEHTLRVMWLASVIAKHEGAEVSQVLKLALVHDISESRSVDVHYLSRQYVVRHEEEATRDSLAGTAVAEEFLALFKEYETRETLAAKIVKDADNLDVDLEMKEQAALGVQMANDFAPMRKHVSETKLFTKTAKKLWKAIYAANPSAWHMNGRNRFSAGDWKMKK